MSTAGPAQHYFPARHHGAGTNTASMSVVIIALVKRCCLVDVTLYITGYLRLTEHLLAVFCGLFFMDAAEAPHHHTILHVINRHPKLCAHCFLLIPASTHQIKSQLPESKSLKSRK